MSAARSKRLYISMMSCGCWGHENSNKILIEIFQNAFPLRFIESSKRFLYRYHPTSNWLLLHLDHWWGINDLQTLSGIKLSQPHQGSNQQPLQCQSTEIGDSQVTHRTLYVLKIFKEFPLYTNVILAVIFFSACFQLLFHSMNHDKTVHC